MATGAFERSVFSVERKTDGCVVEIFRIPTDNLEALSVVFRVAADAVLSGGGRGEDGGVVAAARGEAGGDVAVAVEAAELGRSGGDLVTSDTTGRAVQFLVGFREGAGADLGAGGGAEGEQEEQEGGRDATDCSSGLQVRWRSHVQVIVVLEKETQIVTCKWNAE